jgi:hypothetical protein
MFYASCIVHAANSWTLRVSLMSSFHDPRTNTEPVLDDLVNPACLPIGSSSIGEHETIST